MRELIIAIFLVFIMGVLYIEKRKLENPSSSNPEVVSTEPTKAEIAAEKNRIVSQHLAETDAKIRFQEDEAKMRNIFKAPRVGDALPHQGLKPMEAKTIATEPANEGLDFSADRSMEEVRQQLAPKTQEAQARDPEDMIYEQMLENKRAEEYNEAYKKAYIQQYIQYAREQGYHVVVDANMRITEVTPLK